VTRPSVTPPTVAEARREPDLLDRLGPRERALLADLLGIFLEDAIASAAPNGDDAGSPGERSEPPAA